MFAVKVLKNELKVKNAPPLPVPSYRFVLDRKQA